MARRSNNRQFTRSTAKPFSQMNIDNFPEYTLFDSLARTGVVNTKKVQSAYRLNFNQGRNSEGSPSPTHFKDNVVILDGRDDTFSN